MMSMNAAALIIIVASFLEPLYSANSSPQLPIFEEPDNNDESTFYKRSCTDTDDRTNFILTLYVPGRTAPEENSTFYLKRQFDPWGGKRQPKGLNVPSRIKQKLTKRKRQFSPWGGKRSDDRAEQNYDDVVNDEEISYILSKKRNVKHLENKRNFQLRRGKRNFQPWGGKRNFQPWGGKRNFRPWGGKRNFQPWGGKRNFQPWGGKRNFRPWGGKRSPFSKRNSNFNAWGWKRSIRFENEEENANYDTNIESKIKKQGSLNTSADKINFKSGAKTAFSSWGGKRTFNT